MMSYNLKDFEKKRWISFIAALFVSVCAGFGYAWSVFQTPIVESFGWDVADVSLTFTVTIVMSTMSPLFFGGFIKKLKTKHVILIGGIFVGTGLFFTSFITSVLTLYLAYGVLAGIGVGLIYPSLMSYSVMLFPDKKGLASGCMAAAYGSGAVIWAPVAANIIEKSTLGAAFRTLGLCFFIVIIIGSFFLKQIPEGFIEKIQTKVSESQVKSQSVTKKVEDKTRWQMTKTLTFYIMIVTFTFGTTSGLMVIGQASPILQSTLAFTSAKAAIFVGILSLFNTLGRLFWGTISDKLGRFNVMICLFIIAGISMLSLTMTVTPVLVIVAMALVASCYGAFSTVIAPCTADMFGTKNLTENYGLMYIVFGFASILGPRIAVTCKEMSGGSYAIAFMVAASLSLIGLLLVIYLKHKVTRNNN